MVVAATTTSTVTKIKNSIKFSRVDIILITNNRYTSTNIMMIGKKMIISKIHLVLPPVDNLVTLMRIIMDITTIVAIILMH